MRKEPFNVLASKGVSSRLLSCELSSHCGRAGKAGTGVENVTGEVDICVGEVGREMCPSGEYQSLHAIGFKTGLGEIDSHRLS